MSNSGHKVIAAEIFVERWPGYAPVDTKLLQWSMGGQVKIEVVVDLEVDPTEESNGLSWGNN